MSQTRQGGGRNAEQRRKRAAELRAAQQREERRRRMLAITAGAVGVLVVLGAVAGVVLSQRGGTSKPGGQIVPAAIPSGPVTTQAKVVPVKDNSGIPGVLAWNTGNYPGNGSPNGALEHQHVAGPVKYAVTPPVGGPHNATWMNAGVYTKPVPSERAVHDMEHGAVWITYRPNLPAKDVATLTALVGKQSLISEAAASPLDPQGQQNRYVDLSPWADNSLPSAVVISAWGHQLRVDSASDPRLQKFIDVFRHNRTYSPEYGSSVDGIPVQTGGRAAQYGVTKPNPAGTGAGGM